MRPPTDSRSLQGSAARSRRPARGRGGRRDPPRRALRPRCLLLLAGALLAAGPLAGCGPSAEDRIGYYAAPRRDLVAVRRVAMLPLANETDHPGTAFGLNEELFRSVQGRRLFHVRPVPPETSAGTGLPGAGSRPLRLTDLAHLRRALGADAVLAGAVTRWQPYPRMQLGLYLRLVDLRDGRVLWAVDHVWDATDEQVQGRIRRFFRDEMGTGTDPFGWELGTVSPRAFQKFVAQEVAGTLPSRTGRALRLTGASSGL